MSPTMSAWHHLLVALACLGLGAWALWLLQRGLRHWRMARMRRLGRSGEQTAAGLLAAAGYGRLDSQATRTTAMRIDGVDVAYEVRADYLASRAGRRWVVEVKAGTTVCDPTHRDTRRQLLEYRVVYGDLAGVLLVDVPARRIHTIEFPDLAPRQHNRGWRTLVTVALGAALVGAGGALWLIGWRG